MIRCNIEKELAGNLGTFMLNVDFSLERHKTLALFGASGVGKTSILRMVAGLMDPDKGRIEVNGKVWFDKELRINLSPQVRKVGYVFQDYALFPAMTVLQNIRYAAGDQGEDIVQELIDLMELGELKNRRPALLSGGQKQRVALARAVAQRPNLLLLDEPLAALDAELRLKLQEHLMRITKQFELTSILVSHDLPEIFKMADRVVRISNGRVVEEGEPEDVFANDQVSGKFQFIGQVYELEHQDLNSIVRILVGHQMVRVVIDLTLGNTLAPGDRVLVATKAFNPVVQKIV